MLKPKIIKWMTYEDLEQIQKEIQIEDAMSRYIPEIYEVPFDEFHQDVLIQELVKNNYIICGDTHQNFAIPIFNDGFLMLSMRKWAEIMDEAAMLMNPVAYVRGNYSSISFYIACTGAVKENLPVLDER